MTSRRIDAGPLVAVLGAVVLLVSLFLDFYEPGLTAWQVFEIEDLLLAAAAIVGGLSAAYLAGAPFPAIDGRVLGWAAGIALVLVVATLLNHPPAVSDQADPDLGLWLALAGAALMAAGALFASARVHVTLHVEQRRTRVAAVDARHQAEPEAKPPAVKAKPTPTQETKPLEPPDAKL